MKKIYDLLGPEYEPMPPVPLSYFPKVTVLYTLVCIAIFGVINITPTPNAWANINLVGGGNAQDIWNGKLWPLFTNNFIHIELWHILFNLFLLYEFGRKIEYEEGPWVMLWLTIPAAFVSSGAQIAWSGDNGIGFSGIGYALFGYLWAKNRYDGRYMGFLRHNTIIYLLVWLVLCIVLTATDVFQVANGAHIGGLLWGLLIGYLPLVPRLWRAFLVIPLFLLFMVPAKWAPWQVSYLSHEAYNLHKAHKYDEALVLYDKILKRDGGNDFAKANKKNIVSYITQLAFAAAVSTGDYAKAIAICDSTQQIYPNDTLVRIQRDGIYKVLYTDTTQ